MPQPPARTLASAAWKEEDAAAVKGSLWRLLGIATSQQPACLLKAALLAPSFYHALQGVADAQREERSREHTRRVVTDNCAGQRCGCFTCYAPRRLAWALQPAA
jgi:hypothetical protein